jgi:hypothetical protein
MNNNQIVAVVVLYKRLPEQSQTIASLGTVFADNPELLDSIRVILFDNSPKGLEQVNLSFPCDYYHSDQNVGTSGAYNYALQFAETGVFPWLLLFDQDTKISAGFLPRMLEYSHLLLGQMEIGSVVPFIYSHGSLVSPTELGRFNRMSHIPSSFNGIYRQSAFAVNSATLMRVKALREIGGYSDEFWLDLSDIYVFQAMYRKGRYLYVAGTWLRSGTEIFLQRRAPMSIFIPLLSNELFTSSGSWRGLYGNIAAIGIRSFPKQPSDISAAGSLTAGRKEFAAGGSNCCCAISQRSTKDGWWDSWWRATRALLS